MIKCSRNFSIFSGVEFVFISVLVLQPTTCTNIWPLTISFRFPGNIRYLHTYWFQSTYSWHSETRNYSWLKSEILPLVCEMEYLAQKGKRKSDMQRNENATFIYTVTSESDFAFPGEVLPEDSSYTRRQWRWLASVSSCSTDHFFSFFSSSW